MSQTWELGTKSCVGPACVQQGVVECWEEPGRDLGQISAPSLISLQSWANYLSGLSPKFLICKAAILKHTLPALTHI